MERFFDHFFCTQNTWEKNSICFLTRNMRFDLPNELFFASLYCENRLYSSVFCWVFCKYALWTMLPKHQRSRQPLQPSFARISSVSRGKIPFPHDQSFPVKSRRQKRKFVLRVCKRNTFCSAFVETSPGYLPLMSLDTEQSPPEGSWAASTAKRECMSCFLET